MAAKTVRRVLRENGLSIVLALFFLGSLVPMSVSGFLQHNEDLSEHGGAPLRYSQYLRGDHFLEATTENWESEFLQMFLYVLLTVFLFQKGSSESKELDEPEEVDREPSPASRRKNSPWPVRRGGLVLKVYENSLSLAFLLLFVASLVLHALSGAGNYNQEQAQHGGGAVTVIQYVAGSRFWFESLQNWQSEFLSMLAMVALPIFLRQKGSPESKPVDSPHSQTGS